MIVTPPQARAIIAGRLTLVCLPVRGGRAGAPYTPIAFKLAHDYPIATRRGGQLATIRVCAVTRERLGSLTLRGARAAGQRTTDDYRQAWVRRHDRAWLARHKVDLAACFGDDVVPFILNARFEQRWSDAQVWAVRFVVHSDAARFMAVQRGRAHGDDAGQYTPIAADAIDAAEAVPARWLDREARRRGQLAEAQRADARAGAAIDRANQRKSRIAMLRATPRAPSVADGPDRRPQMGCDTRHDRPLPA